MVRQVLGEFVQIHYFFVAGLIELKPIVVVSGGQIIEPTRLTVHRTLQHLATDVRTFLQFPQLVHYVPFVLDHIPRPVNWGLG